MGEWVIHPDVLAKSRFTVSPLIETVAALKALGGQHETHPTQRAWIDAHASAYRVRLGRDPFAAAFVNAALRPRWVADFLVTPPADSDGTLDSDLRRLRATSPEEARAQLTADDGRPLALELQGSDLIDRAADLLTWIWTHTVRPEWPRRRRLLEADIVSRTQQLGSGGWVSTLATMRPDMRWLGDGRLQVNAYDHPPQELVEAELSFIPTTSRKGWIGLDGPHRYTLVYPCAGILADPAGAVAPEALSRLLGPVRAHILTLLESPKTPTQLVALTGHGLGSVGGHLKVLLDAQLVHRRRSGRTVLYYRTPGGDRLVSSEWS